MNAFKRQCIELRKRDYTLLEIVKITGRPKTSVHFHIRGLPLSAEKRRKIGEANAARARAIAFRRRRLSAKKISRFHIWNGAAVSLVAHLLFDGEIKYGACVYSNRNIALIGRVENFMKTIYPVEPKRYTNGLTGVFRISYYNVSLVEYIKEKSVQLLQNIHSMSRECKREFLRSFFDDEGCIDYKLEINQRRIRGYQKKVEILSIVEGLLHDFDIESHIQLPNEIVMVGKGNLLKFQREINFSPGVRINGKRSNSIWKRPLEKRLLLRKAIASYKPIGSNGVHIGQ